METTDHLADRHGTSGGIEMWSGKGFARKEDTYNTSRSFISTLPHDKYGGCKCI